MLASLYVSGDSWLHRMDARVKLLLAVCGLTLIFCSGNLWVMVAIIVAEQALLLSAGISGERLRGVWQVLWVTIALVFVLWVLFYQGQGPALLTWWRLHLTWDGLARGGVVALRLAAVAFMLFTWLFTTSETHLVLGLQWLGLPYSWGLTLAMGLRYVPTMAELFRMTAEAQQARGLDLSRSGPVARARAYVPITIAMLISALRAATNLAHALETRAFGASTQRSSLQQLHLRQVDLWSAIAIALATATLLGLRFLLGWGAAPLRLAG